MHGIQVQAIWPWTSLAQKEVFLAKHARLGTAMPKDGFPCVHCRQQRPRAWAGLSWHEKPLKEVMKNEPGRAPSPGQVALLVVF